MEQKEFEVICPHCKEYVIIEQVNCAIFRHGMYKQNFIQINPHLSKNECDNLILNNLIYGCGKPFKIEKNHENILMANICDYI
jgi:hypothetical protein